MNPSPANKYDKTAQVEMKLNKVLKELRDKSEVEEEAYNQKRSTADSSPRLYGLPKIYKKDCPLRPIASMIGSAQHNLVQYIYRFLQPVSDRCSSFCFLRVWMLC